MDGTTDATRIREGVNWILEPLADLKASHGIDPFGPPKDLLALAFEVAADRYRKASRAPIRAAAQLAFLDTLSHFEPDSSQTMRERILEDVLRPAEVEALHAPKVTWASTAEIFAPLLPTPWVSRDLQLGPGRPTLVAGYGGSMKTLAAQALAMAFASGTPAWSHFPVERGLVKHFDYEQGMRATSRRYQRLAIGMHIDAPELGDRLQLAVFPEIYLTDAKAVDEWSRQVRGASVVIVDAFRGAIPSADENESGVRVYLDNLTRVSEKTGATFIVIHHAGKPKDGHADARTVARGSSAIFDAAGCVLLLSEKKKGAPRLVQQVKSPADAEAAAVPDFTLGIEDVPSALAGISGVRVVYGAVEPKAEPTAQAAFDAVAGRVVEFVRDNPRCSSHALKAKLGLSGTRAREVLAVLIEEGRVHELPGKNGGNLYTILGTV